MTHYSNQPPTTALLLGAGGLIPYIVLSSLSVFSVGTQQEYLIFILLAYSATIISFLGAIHWGLTLREALPDRLRLIWGVIPSLAAWISLILNAPTGLYIQIIVLWICLLVDIKTYPRHDLSKWLAMRLTLTLVASISLVITALNITFLAR
jgi:hypothetical protein